MSDNDSDIPGVIGAWVAVAVLIFVVLAVYACVVFALATASGMFG